VTSLLINSAVIGKALKIDEILCSHEDPTVSTCCLFIT